MRGRKPGEPSGGCRICALKASDPLRVASLENRLALGERQCDLVKEYGFDRFKLRRHWAHCNQAAVLRRVHQRDREATPQELLEMTVAERERPLKDGGSARAKFEAMTERIHGHIEPHAELFVMRSNVDNPTLLHFLA